MTLYQVDAFTPRPFAGNPAAVCILQAPLDDALMQQIATEMNLSETAFLLKQEDGYNLRWFTPAYEVDLCGHATLASAHVLWTTGTLRKDEAARFHSRSGLLKAKYGEAGIELDFPSQPPSKADAPPALLESLGVTPVYAGYNGADYLLEIEDAASLRSLTPDFRQMAQVPMRGVIVTAQSDDPQFDFISRFFAPSAGIDEDPVTGSAHCCLAPYWVHKLQKPTMKARQVSPRGGNLTVKVEGDRVFLTGRAVTVLEGELKFLV